MQSVAWLVGAHRLHVELQIGSFEFGTRATEDADLACRKGHGPTPAQRVIEADAQLAGERIYVVVQRDGSVDFVYRPDLKMVLQVGADPWQVRRDGDAKFG